MGTSTFLDILSIEVTTLQAQHPILADALGRAQAIVTDGRLFPEDDGRRAMVRSSDGATWYAVNGQCPCKASQHREEPCKHRLAFRLYQRVCDRLVEEEERYTIDLGPDTIDMQAPEIPAHYLTTIQGRPFVKFEGLLHLAHERGLVSLETTIVQVSTELAVCQATAVFQDGRRFADIGDATPENVAKHLRPHFVRMAATRASARALRRGLNVTPCSVEELGVEEGA
jgi:hypothetical protein